MRPLRVNSCRPGLLVDPQGFRLVDPDTLSRLGRPGPFGRARVVSALPTGGLGPLPVRPPAVVHDPACAYLGDPDGALIGVAGLTVHRMLTARWVEDTRRL